MVICLCKFNEIDGYKKTIPINGYVNVNKDWKIEIFTSPQTWIKCSEHTIQKLRSLIAQSAGAVKYTDCASAEK